MRSSVVFVLCIQEVFIAEEWVKEARNEVKVEANLCSEVDKALGTSEQQVQELSSKLIVKERERKSTKAGLKITKVQTEEQSKKFHYTEIQ